MKKATLTMLSTLFPVTMVAAMMLFQPVAQAKTDHVVIENGDQALSNEAARQDKEQWDDTRALRKKVNSRAEKDFNRTDRAVDNREACEKSFNTNVYWEPNTLRCLDRRNGRPSAP